MQNVAFKSSLRHPFPFPKSKVTKEQIEAVSYFLEEGQDLYLPEKSLEHIFEGDSQIMVVKASHGTADREDPVSVRVLEVVYGAMKHPPGNPECPYQKLIKYPSAENVLSSNALPATSLLLDESAETERKSKTAVTVCSELSSGANINFPRLYRSCRPSISKKK